jgi:xanthine dehydrogenase accessory factor
MNRLPREWVVAVAQMLKREPAVVRIVVAEVRGSAPREAGAFMLVGRDGVEGTIGGGRLEWESISAARELLEETSAAARLSKVVLGADLGQCCGGVVAVWLERFTPDDVGLLRLAGDAGARGPAVLSSVIKDDGVERRLVGGVGGGDSADGRRAGELLSAPRALARPVVVRGGEGQVTFLERLDDESPALWLYGAGHVGQALARILAELPLRLTWIDARAELFPAVVPEGVRVRRDADSLATVSDAPPGAYFLVMTHSHPLDFALCQAILTRNDFAWMGLIGSASKAARFRSRLARAGVDAATIGRLVCPIGVEGIESKWPAAIAVAVAAQVMQRISMAPQLDGSGQREGAQRREGAQNGARAALARTRAGSDDQGQPARADEANCGVENCATCGTAGAREGAAQGGADASAAGAGRVIPS